MSLFETLVQATRPHVPLPSRDELRAAILPLYRYDDREIHTVELEIGPGVLKLTYQECYRETREPRPDWGFETVRDRHKLIIWDAEYEGRDVTKLVDEIAKEHNEI